jgi:hypothetical protein
MKIRDVLKLKEARYREVVSIAPGETVSEAVRKLMAYDRGVRLPSVMRKGGWWASSRNGTSSGSA